MEHHRHGQLDRARRCGFTEGLRVAQPRERSLGHPDRRARRQILPLCSSARTRHRRAHCRLAVRSVPRPAGPSPCVAEGALGRHRPHRLHRRRRAGLYVLGQSARLLCQAGQGHDIHRRRHPRAQSSRRCDAARRGRGCQDQPPHSRRTEDRLEGEALSGRPLALQAQRQILSGLCHHLLPRGSGLCHERQPHRSLGVEGVYHASHGARPRQPSRHLQLQGPQLYLRSGLRPDAPRHLHPPRAPQRQCRRDSLSRGRHHSRDTLLARPETHAAALLAESLPTRRGRDDGLGQRFEECEDGHPQHRYREGYAGVSGQAQYVYLRHRRGRVYPSARRGLRCRCREVLHPGVRYGFLLCHSAP